MRIPNCENAFVDIRKLRDYSLNTEHLRGRHKARVFASALGLTADDADILQENLLEIVCDDTVIIGELDAYGQRYTVDFVMTQNDHTATVRSNWMIRAGEDFPRLTSCYVL